MWSGFDKFSRKASVSSNDVCVDTFGVRSRKASSVIHHLLTSLHYPITTTQNDRIANVCKSFSKEFNICSWWSHYRSHSTETIFPIRTANNITGSVAKCINSQFPDASWKNGNSVWQGFHSKIDRFNACERGPNNSIMIPITVNRFQAFPLLRTNGMMYYIFSFKDSVERIWYV